jgi:RND family efflux transporter MFP subunit
VTRPLPSATVGFVRLSVLFAMAAVIGAGALAGLLTRPPRARPLAAAASTAVATPAAQAPAARADFLGVVLSGETVDLAPKIDGRLQAVRVKPGDRVLRGAVVAELDTRAARQALALAEASLADAQERLKRRSGLAEGVLSVEEISNARVLVLDKKARVDELRSLVTDARLRAPFDGVVAQRYVDAGAMAGPTRPVVRLLGARDARVRFAVTEESAARVTVGMRAWLTVKASDRPLPLRVESVAPEVDTAARVIFAVARVEAPAPILRKLSDGMVGRVSIDDEGERAPAR